MKTNFEKCPPKLLELLEYRATDLHDIKLIENVHCRQIRLET